MIEKINKISNPLTVISIFAAITEVIGIGVIPFVSEQNQGQLIQFVIWFPILLVILFFLTLNFNNKVLYAPTDYREDKSFLAASNIQNSTIEDSEEDLDSGILVGKVEMANTEEND